MKILAIRGRNLTALAGDFEIVLDRAPLAGAGLFALTGPTGAGKTTLLDALCLALYDRTPRLGSRTAVKVAAGSEGEALSAQDPRHLLRRGCGEGFAEVEFLGRDGARYRARWSVWRTRNDPAGKLQFAELELRSADGGLVVGGRKTDVLEAIEKRIGLNFEQFTRSVLLAQGDFAAFLRAPAKERAELLERMTGTVLFREISIAAYQRMAAAVQKRDALARERDATPRLEPEARKNIADALQITLAALPAAQERLGHAQRAVQWHAEQARAEGERAEGESDLAAARAGHAGLAPLRNQLNAVERASPLREHLQAFNDSTTQLSLAVQGLAALQTKDAQAQTARGMAQEALDGGETALQSIRERIQALVPEVRAARALDVQVAAAQDHEDRTQAELGEREREHAAALRDEAALARAMGQAQEEVSRLEAERASHAPVELLALDWPRWERLFVRYLALVHEDERLQAAQGEAAQGVEATSRALQQAESERAIASGALRQAEDAVGRAVEATRAHPLAEIPALRAALQLQLERYTQLEALVRRAHELARDQSACRDHDADAQQQIQQAQAEGSRASGAVEQLQVRLDEAGRVVRTLRTRLDLAAHRAELRDGEPCPLCGACEHPFSGGALGDSLLGEAQARVDGLGLELEAARTALLGASTRRAAAEQRHQEQQARLHQLAGQLAQLAEGHAALGEQLPPHSPAARERVEVLSRELAASRRALEAREAAGLQAQAALDHARSQRDALAARNERLRVDEAHLQAQLASAQAAVEQSRKDRERISSELAAARPELDGALAEPHWDQALHTQGPTFLAALTRRVKAAQAHAAACAAASERLTAAQQAHQASAQAVQALLPQVARARAGFEAQRMARQLLQAQRAALLGGRPADHVEAEQAAALAEAESRCVQLRAALDQQVEETSRLGEALQAARTRVHERESLLGQHAAALEQGQRALGLTGEELAALLAHPPEWLSQARATCEAADAAVAKAETVLAERNARLTAHAAARPTPFDAAEAAVQVQQHAGEVETLAARRATLQHQLAEDDAAAQRFQARSLQHQQAQAEAVVWERLGELIGSADGAKFQKFAQGLTLELLLDQANRHLQELAPRYLLQRIPGTELELQVVDREMGDEIRAVASLSGGESFLASLALALGLSALAARETAVDSLFIDEGFGTLDPETLDVALAALDNLQAQGRQVGLISHVAGLAERVGAQVRVVKRGSGRSEVRVVGLEPLAGPAQNLLVVPAAPRKRKPRARAPAE